MSGRVLQVPARGPVPLSKCSTATLGPSRVLVQLQRLLKPSLTKPLDRRGPGGRRSPKEGACLRQAEGLVLSSTRALPAPHPPAPRPCPLRPPPTQKPSVAPSTKKTPPPPPPPKDDGQHAKLAALLASGGGVDTFGNEGIMRVPVGSPFHPSNRLAAQKTGTQAGGSSGSNPFMMNSSTSAQHQQQQQPGNPFFTI
ncbi:hypothetical protein PCASD_04118 [Puccinia coronata f. sp. avenae]|uniref:Uncharacterized protein n=1 Tax=Puccinia coronata f. sp. avenae TaxID=200324 RepID=A0A2N5VCH2_9BASI|nr:hypothetical protein PCASD_04118 [Puccinia coronata f. sp. avenae]